LQIFS